MEGVEPDDGDGGAEAALPGLAPHGGQGVEDDAARLAVHGAEDAGPLLAYRLVQRDAGGPVLGEDAGEEVGRVCERGEPEGEGEGGGWGWGGR